MGSFNRLFILSLCILITATSISAQQNILFRNYSIEDGLPSNRVRCFHQDHIGWIWIGTSHGLCRFDGKSFKTYFLMSPDSEEKSSDVNGIHEDAESRLWIATENAGLALYDRGRDDFSYFSFSDTNTNCISSNYIYSISSDKNGKLLLGTDEGLNRFDPESSNFEMITFTDNASEFDNNITEIYVDKQNKYWIGTENGLYKFDPASGHSRKHPLIAGNGLDNTKPMKITEITEDRNGNILVGTQSNGFFIIDTQEGTTTPMVPEPESPRSKTVRAFWENDNEELWIATRGGIYILDQNNKLIAHHVHNIHDPNSLSHTSVNNLFEDKNGDLWIATRAGFSYLSKNNQAFLHYGSELNDNRYLNNAEIYTLLESENEEIWIGTESGGINILNKETNRFRYLTSNDHNKNSLSSNSVKCIIQDQQENFWIGTYKGGLNVFDAAKNRFTHYKNDPEDQNSLIDNRVWSLLEDHNGNIWIGTDKGINRYNPVQEKLSRFQDIEINSQVFAIYEDSRNNLFFATKRNGLYVLAPNKKIMHYDLIVRVVFEDSNHRIWMGSKNNNGLYLFDINSGILKTYTTSDGLISNQIYGILEDDDGNLWLSTSLGLSMFNFGDENFKNYKAINGRKGNSYNYGAFCKTRSGELLFGGQSGLSVFNPRNIVKNNSIPPVIITSFKVFNEEVPIDTEFYGKIILEKSISETKEIVLDHKHSTLTFGFVALNYMNSSENKYAYMLEGFDKGWNHLKGTRSATYTNLDPGKYTFRVKAANNDGLWNDTGTSCELIITPPFWNTTLFKLLMIVGIGFILFLIFSLIMKRERLKDQLIMERIKSKEMHKIDMMKFQFFTNISHEIRTPVSLILSPLTRIIHSDLQKEQIKKDLEVVHRNATRLGKLIDQLLDYRKLEAGKLKLELCKGDIVSFLKDVVFMFTELSQEKKVHLEFFAVLDEIQMYFDPDKLEKIMFNLLSNAFKHTQEGGNINVIVSLSYHLETGPEEKEPLASGEYVQIQVSDNGPGIPEHKKEKVFERFYHERSTGTNNSGVGIGLSLSRELVKIHNGKISLQSHEGNGTRLTILLPLIKTDPEDETSKELTELKEPKIVPASEIVEQPINNYSEYKPSVLIIEDNKELLEFIHSIFADEYNINTEQDGQSGLKTAQKVSPDIIISDVLMPKMDGMKFCKAIKKDHRTAHIPVVLLTALSSKDHIKEGILAGADDYIVKPFDPSLLKMKVKQLLTSRKLIGEKLQQNIILQPKVKRKVSPDEKLLKKLVSVIEENISDSEFGTVKIAREVGISRTKLYRKIAALTGMTVNEFIRSIRLKKAAQLMLQENLNISEACYEVGFQQVAYFRKCFKKMYRMTPSEYIRKNSEVV